MTSLYGRSLEISAQNWHAYYVIIILTHTTILQVKQVIII